MFRPVLLSANLSARFDQELQEQIRSHRNTEPTTIWDIVEENTKKGSASHTQVSRDSSPTSLSTVEPTAKTAVSERELHHKRSTSTTNASHASRNMAVKTYTWISLWFLLTVPVIFWDAGYCFMRPRSMKGGDLHWIWKPYALYQEIDYVYGVHALQRGDGFTNAQSLLNIVETFMNIGYLYLAHVVGTPTAPLLGFASAVMTLSKTFLYWAQEYYCGGCSVGHNDIQTLIVYWIIPNGLWLVVPSFIIARLTKDITASLRVADKAYAKEMSGKKQ